MCFIYDVAGTAAGYDLFPKRAEARLWKRISKISKSAVM